jgi:hypothetical protein
MKILMVSDKDWALVKRKVEEELHCAGVDVMLARAFRREKGVGWYGEKWNRKRHIEALRLKRIISG